MKIPSSSAPRIVHCLKMIENQRTTMIHSNGFYLSLTSFTSACPYQELFSLRFIHITQNLHHSSNFCEVNFFTRLDDAKKYQTSNFNSACENLKFFFTIFKIYEYLWDVLSSVCICDLLFLLKLFSPGIAYPLESEKCVNL